MERGNLNFDGNGEAIRGRTTTVRVQTRSSGADCPVVVMKRSNVRGAKGQVIRVSSTLVNWKRVQFPGATRPATAIPRLFLAFLNCPQVSSTARYSGFTGWRGAASTRTSSSTVVETSTAGAVLHPPPHVATR